MRGDCNCDGLVNLFDIDCFVSAIVYGETLWPGRWNENCSFCCVNDVNSDGAVNNFDIDAFIDCIVDGEC